MDINEILDKKTRYGIIHKPFSNMEYFIRNNNYIYDFNSINMFETKMDSFTIIHFYSDCKERPSNVTYVLFCPVCSENGQDSILCTYFKTKYSKLRFYLTHSVSDCPVIYKKKCNLITNLLCDHCYDTT